MFIFYWQQGGGEEPWQEALADNRQTLVDSKQPRFTTILDLDTIIRESMTRDDIAAIKYRGPFYVDFDGPDIDTVLPKFREFLAKLQKAELDLHTVRLYASGRKGFHVTTPMEVFLPKPPRQGIALLLAICNEVAYELFVDTLDMRVYTARRGRMFRTVNVERENDR